MQFLLDNIAATMLGGTVLMILAVSQFSANDAVIDQTSYYATRSQIINMTEMIEADFKNIGLGVTPGTPIFNEVSGDAIEFLRLLNNTDPVPSVIRYQKVPTDTLELDGEQVPVFRVERLVNGVMVGHTPDRMREWVVELRNVEGDPVVNVEDAETVHVRFLLVPPFNEDKGYIRQAHWTRTYAPPNL